MNFENFILTDVGIAARQDVIANGKTIHFTRGAVGGGKPNSEAEIPAMTALVDFIQDIPITSTQNLSNEIQMTVTLDNAETTEQFHISEVGIFAQIEGEDEILYAYSYSDSGLTILANTTSYVTEWKTTTKISRTAQVQVIFDNSIAYLTQADGQNIQVQIDEHQHEINALKGVGGAIPHTDLGSTPTAEQITQYACEQIWGAGGVFEWNETEPGNSTYTDPDGKTHLALDIWNGTWIRNDYDNHRLVLNNTKDTDPPIFEWADVGIDTVAIATKTTAGIIKADDETQDTANFTVDPTSGAVSFPNFGRTYSAETRPEGLAKNDRWLEIV